jgi:hypothetical protein
VANPPRHGGDPIVPWLKAHYRGNKPSGGLWTSTHTPGEEYSCDWAVGLARNLAIQRGVPLEARSYPAWLLTPDPAARIRVIASLADAREFTREYDLGRAPIPAELRKGLGLLLTRCQSDWERALETCDAIMLTGEAADEITWSQVHEQSDTAFATWNCESTLWGAWKFTSVAALA